MQQCTRASIVLVGLVLLVSWAKALQRSTQGIRLERVHLGDLPLQGVHPHRSILQDIPSSNSSFRPGTRCQGCPRTDTRVLVGNTRERPFSSVGWLTRQQRSSLSVSVSTCTGTLISPIHVLTAAHCVINPDGWRQIEDFEFTPGYSAANKQEPFPSIPVAKTRVLSQYMSLGSASLEALNYDFALVTLKFAAPNQTGLLPIVQPFGNPTFNVSTAGYPGDRGSGNMYTVNCGRVPFPFRSMGLRGCGRQCSNLMQHSCLTAEGQSGSAIYQSDNYTIRAIVTGALQMTDGTVINLAVMMNSFVYNTIASWYNADMKEFGGTFPAMPEGGEGPSSNGWRGWIQDHLWVLIVPAVVVLLLVGFLCFRRTKPRAPPDQTPAGAV